MTSPWQPPIYTQADISSIAPSYSLSAAEVSILSAHSASAKATAYCPYSRFRVGATILTTDGQYFSGANVENASYPVGICAERVAFGKAVTDLAASIEPRAAGIKDEGRGGLGEWKKGKDGVPRGFKALAVSTDIIPPASPCGMCRQFIREFCELDMPIWLFDKDGNFQVVRLEQLLPLSFGPEHLPPPV